VETLLLNLQVVVHILPKGKAMFIVTWLFDKMGYMPKVTVDTAWSFPVVPKATPVAKKPAVKKTTARKKKA
jgi:hypothetical protein